MASPAAAPRVLLGIAALLWLAAMVLPLTTRGVGSVLSGPALADLARDGGLPSFPRWLGATWYLIPLGGAVVLTSLGMTGRPAEATRWAAATIAALAAAVFTVLVTDLDIQRFGAGAWAGTTGSALAAGAAAMTVVERKRDRRAHDVLR